MTTITQPSVRDDLLARAARVIPGGASAGGRPDFGDVITRAQGAYLWNADGKRYIDHLNSYGPIVIGHADPRVNAAVAEMASDRRPQLGRTRRRGRWSSPSGSWAPCHRPRRWSS